MTVLRVDRAGELALCEGADGSQRSVEAAFVTPLAAGDRVLVHAGVAIAALGDGEGAATERTYGRCPPRAERLAR
jgi:hydrogenase maturation factor